MRCEIRKGKYDNQYYNYVFSIKKCKKCPRYGVCCKKGAKTKTHNVTIIGEKNIGLMHCVLVGIHKLNDFMKRFLTKIISLKDDIDQKYIEELKENSILAETAALLHDIGHGPFSHALEKTTKIKHEKWTVEIILGPTEINSILEDYRPGFAREVASDGWKVDKCGTGP